MLWRSKEPNDKPPATPTLEIGGSGAAATPSGAPSTPDSAAAQVVRKRRSDAGQPRGPRGEKLSESEKAILATFEKLYEPEVWEGVVCAPADTMLALTGRVLWQISPQERKTLSVTASTTARCFSVENPKWLALVMLSITIAQIYGSRALMHAAEVRKEDQAKKMRATEKKD